MRVHLDTDLGGDPDDACALALLLGWPDVEIVGITTTIDPDGRRAACMAHCLKLAGRDDIPVAAGAEVSVMGGWTQPPAEGLPAWGPERDWNVQWDTRAAELVATTATQLTLVTLPATLKSHLRARDLPRLRASGRLGQMLARQGEAHAADREMSELAGAHHALPDDLLNFHHDPVTCAVALGWSGAVVEEMRLEPALDGEVLRWGSDQEGQLRRVVVGLDGEGFTDTWLSAVEAAQRDERLATS